MKNKKRIPKKNYVILTCIYLGVILGVLYLASWYTTYQNYQKSIPILQGVVSEIKPVELEHYLLENPNCILYMCRTRRRECREFEQQFKEKILENGWQDAMTYLNLSDVEDESKYLQIFLNQYNSADFDITETPALVSFENGKIVATISSKEDKPLGQQEASLFMRAYQNGV